MSVLPHECGSGFFAFQPISGKFARELPVVGLQDFIHDTCARGLHDFASDIDF